MSTDKNSSLDYNKSIPKLSFFLTFIIFDLSFCQWSIPIIIFKPWRYSRKDLSRENNMRSHETVCGMRLLLCDG